MISFPWLSFRFGFSGFTAPDAGVLNTERACEGSNKDEFAAINILTSEYLSSRKLPAQRCCFITAIASSEIAQFGARPCKIVLTIWLKSVRSRNGGQVTSMTPIL